MIHRVLWFWAFLVAPVSALAHSPIEGIDSFYNGLLHPLFVPAHLLLLIALGLFIGQRGSEKNQVAIVVFLGAILFGLAVAWFDVALQLELSLLVVAAVVGVMIASNLAMATIWCTFIAAVVGLFLGMDSAQESLTGKEKLGSLFGSGVGIYLLFLYPMAFADYFNKRHWQQIGIRIIGSWVAASALLVLALSFSTTSVLNVS